MSNPISDFQMKAFNIHTLNIKNFLIPSYSECAVTHDFQGETNCEYREADSSWRGTLLFGYMVESVEHEKLSLTLQASAYFTYSAPNTDEEKNRFEKLIRLNGMVSFLPILRGRISAAAAVLGLPEINIPSLDLKKFEWK